MAEFVASVGGCEGDGCCDDVDGDAHYVGADGGPPELFEDRWGKEGCCVAGVYDAKVYQRTGGLLVS